MFSLDEPFIRWKDLDKILEIYTPLFKNVATDYIKWRLEIERKVEIPVSDFKFVKEDGTIITVNSGTISCRKEVKK